MSGNIAKNKKHEIDMTTGKLFSKIVAFAVPLILTSFLQLLFNSADMVVVGKFVSSEATGAVGSTGSLNHLIITLFIGMSVGAGVVLSNAYGAKDKVYGDKVLHSSMILSVIGGVIVGIVGFFLSPIFLTLMGTPGDLLPLASLYLKIIFVGAPFNLVYNFGAAMLRATGDTKRPLIYLTVAGIINIIVNVISVTLLRMGVAGVAFATIVSQAVSAVLVVVALIKNDGFVTLSLKKLKLDRRAVKEIIKLGVPTGLQNAMFSISNVVLQSAINGLGSNEAITGCSIAGQIEGYVYLIVSSISSTALTAVGQNYGANNFPRIKASVIECLIFTTVANMAVGGLATLFASPLAHIFTNPVDSPEKTALIVDYVYRHVLIVCTFYFLDGVMEVSTFSMRGMGYSILPTVFVFVGTCLFRLFWIYCIYPLYPTFTFLFFIYPVSWTITFVPSIIAFAVLYKKKKNADEKRKAAQAVVDFPA